MKNLIITRHAKSSWGDLTVADKDRKLNSRGNRDAPVMARKLSDLGYSPQLALVSSSQRTRETVAYFEKVFDFHEVEYHDKLYHPSEQDIIDVTMMSEEKYDSIIVFSHNPAVTIFANEITDTYLDNIPTCGILICEADIDEWAQLDFSNIVLKKLIFPKMFL